MDYGSLFGELARPSLAGSPSIIEGGLSAEQQLALNSPLNSSATICAGAGAGKTKLLVERVIKLVQSGVNPKDVAVVTFTKKSAIEIGARINRRFAGKKSVPVCSTVHALALSGLVRLKESINLLDEAGADELLLLLRLELPDDLAALSNSELLLELNRCREEEVFDGIKGIAAQRYAEIMEAHDVCDFTSLLYLAITKSKPRFKYILVDESQDLSKLQCTYLKSIGMPNAAYYWYIGDPDQGIYTFRGANQGVMQKLQGECSEQFILSVNYRSATKIVDHANNVIQANPDRQPIIWKAHRTVVGTVSVVHFETGEDEMLAAKAWLGAGSSRVVLARTQALVASLKDDKLMACTVHESKGLEWDEVWIIGCENGLFPHPLSHRNEERRLFYVAMTRARENLVMSYCATRRSANNKKLLRNPSIFLYEAQAL
jgi:DNA helicase-2/ATP-dependent DNA helicase PcrA